MRALRSSVTARVPRDDRQYRGGARPVAIVQPSNLVTHFEGGWNLHARIFANDPIDFELKNGEFFIVNLISIALGT